MGPLDFSYQYFFSDEFDSIFYVLKNGGAVRLRVVQVFVDCSDLTGVFPAPRSIVESIIQHEYFLPEPSCFHAPISRYSSIS